MLSPGGGGWLGLPGVEGHPQALAEERGAAVLVLETMDDALEALPTEAYGGMTVITLPDAQALSALQEAHPEATLVEPTGGTATAYLALIEAF